MIMHLNFCSAQLVNTETFRQILSEIIVWNLIQSNDFTIIDSFSLVRCVNQTDLFFSAFIHSPRSIRVMAQNL